MFERIINHQHVINDFTNNGLMDWQLKTKNCKVQDSTHAEHNDRQLKVCRQLFHILNMYTWSSTLFSGFPFCKLGRDSGSAKENLG